ncbi:MAG: magnesium transporter [Clostridia bacterium]|nr:magnesium transporter [Clostridia bacterium]
MTLNQNILALMEEKKYKTLRDVLNVMRPFDIAELFDSVEGAKRPVLFRLLPKELAADTFIELDEDIQQQLIESFTDSELSAVINDLYVDDVADIIDEMPANVVKRILRGTSPDMRKKINEILRYPEDSAGSIMNTEYISLRQSMTVQHAIEHIRTVGVDKEMINTLYVIDKCRRLVGFVSIRDLLFAKDQSVIDEVMFAGDVLSVSTLDDKENVARAFENYNATELPVVDGEQRLVGIITVDDAIDVITQEATEDIERMAAITPSDKPYLKTSALELFLKRIPWLLVLMISATFTGIIISSFETALSALPILTAFIPMLMGSGGNCGSQASVTIIRSISLGDVEFRDILRVMFKEFRVSIYCGAALAVVNFAKICFVDRYIMGSEVTVLVAFVVSITLFVTVIIAKFVGCSMPLLAKKIGFDPAVMASPFITTTIDALSLLVYFAFAVSILNL